MRDRTGACAVALLAAAQTFPARADAPEEQGRAFDVHGFASQGFLWSTDNNYLAHSARGSFEFSELALNLTKPLVSDVRVGGQLFAHRLGPIGDLKAIADWYYVDWHRFDAFAVRAGRVKLPFGLYNESSDYDAGRTIVLLPQSLYSITSRDFLLAATGVAVYGNVAMGGAGGLSYAAVGGTLFLDTSQTISAPGTVVDVPYVAVARLAWDLPVPGLRLAASGLYVRLDFDTTVAGQPVSGRLPAVLDAVSLSFARGPFGFAAEYGRWWVAVEGSTNPAVFPNLERWTDRGYVAGVYNLTERFSCALYGSVFFADVDHREGRQNYQHDGALALRYDLTDNWLFKVEAHAIQGTASLNPALNGNRPRTQLVPDWGLLVLKTTAYF